jgi:hypothetical protein
MGGAGGFAEGKDWEEGKTHEGREPSPAQPQHPPADEERAADEVTEVRNDNLY